MQEASASMEGPTYAEVSLHTYMLYVYRDIPCMHLHVYAHMCVCVVYLKVTNINLQVPILANLASNGKIAKTVSPQTYVLANKIDR